MIAGAGSRPLEPRALIGGRALGRALATLIFPAMLAVVLLRFALPSRLEGARGGLTGLIAYLGDQHSLLAGLAIFIALSEVGRYWTGRLVPDIATRARPRWHTRFLVVGLVAIAALVIVVRGSVAAVVRVVGPSMLPTLEIGDRLLVNRLAYGLVFPFSSTRRLARVPLRGDLVVLHGTGPGASDGPEFMVKRVVGIPGDQIELQQNQLRINGWAVPSCDAGPYVALTGRLTVRGRLTVEFLGDRAYLTVRKPMEQVFSGYRVKPGEVFVIGDDRGVSTDSRIWSEGHGSGVPIEALEGRVSRVLLGGMPDGRVDLSRLWQPPLDLLVRHPGLDMRVTQERIDMCMKAKPEVTWPPAPIAAQP